MAAWRQNYTAEDDSTECYDLPFGNDFIKRYEVAVTLGFAKQRQLP